MASNYPRNYNLCQWEASDKVLRTEFNADNAKIDAAIAAVDGRVDGLSSTVSDKASTAALENLKTTVSQHTSELAKKGNCQLFTTTYTGSGKFGSSNPNRLTFAKKPMVIFVHSNTSLMTLVQGMGISWAATNTGSSSAVSVTWSGNSVSWYGDQTYSQLSYNGAVYHVLALLQAG